MGFIEQIPVIGPAAYYLLPFILVLGIVVAVHEYGHYIVAKWCGVHSDVFSIGFGPELFGWDDSKGTRWKVCLIPLGGYVKFRGDADAASAQTDDEALSEMTEEELAHSFPRAALWRRACIVAAGPVFNFVLAVIVLAGVALAVGMPSDRPVVGEVTAESEGGRAGFEPGDRILALDGDPVDSFTAFGRRVIDGGEATYEVEIERAGRPMTVPFSYRYPATLTAVVPGAAEEAGIRPGDTVVAIGGEPVDSFGDLRRAVRASGGEPLVFTVERGGERLDFEVTPRANPRAAEAEADADEPPFLIGVQAGSDFGMTAAPESVGPVDALGHGVTGTYNVLANSLAFIADIFRGEADSADLGGPIRIAEVSGDAADDGFASLLRLVAILSASIGLINLFPIPVLDGGHLLFYAIEAVRGRPMSQRMQEIGLTIGLAMVVMLMVYATYNDVLRHV